MTQKAQDIDDLKGQKVQDIGDPDYYNKLCYTLSQIYLLGVLKWNKKSGKRLFKDI